MEDRMEGASASILSPAAELATPGMDSADQEPELPSAVQDFIRRLGEKSINLQYQSRYYEPLISSAGVKEFFPWKAPFSTNTGWQSQVRLQVLEAIGSFISSFDLLELKNICGDDISRLTASEWEIVLRGFRSSSFLRRIRISQLTWSSEADLESLGVQLGIILNTSSVTELTINSFRLTARFFLNLASGLPENSHSKLKSLEVRSTWEDGANAMKFIVEVLNGHHQLETLILVSPNHVDDAVVRLLCQALKQNSCLKELVLQEVEGGSAALLLNALAGDDGNRSIERLQLVDISRDDGNRSKERLQLVDISRIWNQLLRVLRENTSVTSLSFELDEQNEEFKDRGFEKEFRDVMALLQVNLTLREIDVSKTPWARDGKAALIEAALKQNQERAVYMSVFTEAKLPFGDAKAGRLFLCGSPRAGKTQLRRTLMKIIQDKSWLGERCEELSRTNGIEVEFLQNDDKMQISIWDLAGQWIFRTLQNVLFPTTNDFCVFLFVYSPFCEKKFSRKPDSCFRTELEGWLTFIASSIKVTGHNLPQVLVVISHKDKMESSSLTWANSIVEVLRKRFAKFVDLCPFHHFFHVDAREKNQVIPLKQYVFIIFQELLSQKSPRIPQLCFKLSSLLLSNIAKNKGAKSKTWPLWSLEKFHDYCFILPFLLLSNMEKNENCPLWSLEKFHAFCHPSLKQLNLPSSVDHLRLLNSLLSYLNDVGSIIYIPNFDHIVVDPNWLTNSVLGELIAMGQNFQAQESNACENTMYSYTSKDGFVSESEFTRLIETFLEKQSHLHNVDREVLEKILFNLDLGFKLEDSSQYFIPSFIPEYASMEEQKQQEGARVVSMSWDSTAMNPKFVGIRIQCKDLNTMSMSAAFFPRFQMFMRRKLISEMSMSMETLTLSRHYMKLFLEGHEIYVEHVQSEKFHYYVDVLILCSEHKSKEEAIKYVVDNIVQELISFCASPKGCPGVALVLGVIQTFCVENLIPGHLRGAILIEELKSKFSNSINDKLGDIALDRSQLMKEKKWLNYEHTWPRIPALHLEPTFERATNLLWKSDVEAVVNEMELKRNQQVESLQQILISLNNHLAPSHTHSEITVSNSSLPHIKDCNLASTNCSSQASTSQDAQPFLFKTDQLGEYLGGKMDKLGEYLGGKVDGVHEEVRLVKSIVQGLDVKMGHIISLHQQHQSMLSEIMSKVDRMIGYSESHQQSKMPKRPYITEDVGELYKMSARLHMGKALRLRLMCESIIGFHPVDGQEGLKLRVDLKNSGWIARIIDFSYKIVYYGAKLGAISLGKTIPQWDDLQTDIVRLKNISDTDSWAIHNGGQSEELNEAWSRIQQTLAPLLKDNYSKIFKLYQVKYLRQQNGGHAWVCEECMTKGLLSRSLTC